MKALLLDRDGVINEDYGYVHSVSNFVFKPGLFDLGVRARDMGFVIIVITNQAGIGRGYYTEKDFIDVNAWMIKQFALNDIDILQTYWCPHHPIHGVGGYKKDCQFRKPHPGMILKAAGDHGLNLSKSILIGDKLTDMQAGHSAGVKRLCLLGNDDASPVPHERILHLDHFKF
jgi:D-glycero-D-manno-heptose 1,7-bisphosphate phosphatase